MKKLILPFLFVGLMFPSFAQIIPKSLEAKRTTQKVIIDGKLNEPAWGDAAKADNFIEFRPEVGRTETAGDHTETFLMYNDEGIYFGGTCYENNIAAISKELVGRDGFGANDYIGIIFDTYNDNLNGFEYFVTPLGEQWDAKMTPNTDDNGGGEDFSWNAVWQSAVVIHEKGWTFEVFLPYSAIRFGKDKIQNWGLNITRRRRKTEQQNTWSAIDPKINGFLTQEGTWNGITDIKPPLRLQLYPYFSFYENHFPAPTNNQNSWSNQISGGLDLKLGLNQAFTLDATLVPDFGQVQSDNKVLNLTPFEVKFNEYRTFFTEGTELFNKGNLFYSRRIGGTPINYSAVYDNLAANEEVLHNPTESRLINASKISGRTQKGLGVGILNAITKAQYAQIKNTETGEIREEETNPATNYNIIVLDQTFKHNSSISFINTNVTRNEGFPNANVSAGLFSFYDKKNTYNFSGKAAVSRLNYKSTTEPNSLGYSHSFSFGKNSGKITYSVSQELTDTKFTSNDLGYFTNNNFLNHYGYIGYRIIEPKNWYNRIFLNFNASISHLYEPIGDFESKYQNANLRFNFNAQTKSLVWLGLYANYSFRQNDFYETRGATNLPVFQRGNSFAAGGWIETNYAKKYSVSLEAYERIYFNFYQLNGTDLFARQTYRFNSKFSVTYSLSAELRPKSLGFTTFDGDLPIFAFRDVKTYDNILSLKYNFTNKMGLTFRARHYVSTVFDKELHLINADGTLGEKVQLANTTNRNANYFNIDMVYTWQFAPGSFINVVWKNNTINNSESIDYNYLENLQNTLKSEQNNNFSVKVIYFLDYLQLKGLVTKKKNN